MIIRKIYLNVNLDLFISMHTFSRKETSMTQYIFLFRFEILFVLSIIISEFKEHFIELQLNINILVYLSIINK